MNNVLLSAVHNNNYTNIVPVEYHKIKLIKIAFRVFLDIIMIPDIDSGPQKTLHHTTLHCVL